MNERKDGLRAAAHQSDDVEEMMSRALAAGCFGHAVAAEMLLDVESGAEGSAGAAKNCCEAPRSKRTARAPSCR